MLWRRRRRCRRVLRMAAGGRRHATRLHCCTVPHCCGTMRCGYFCHRISVCPLFVGPWRRRTAGSVRGQGYHRGRRSRWRRRTVTGWNCGNCSVRCRSGRGTELVDVTRCGDIGPSCRRSLCCSWRLGTGRWTAREGVLLCCRDSSVEILQIVSHRLDVGAHRPVRWGDHRFEEKV